MNIAVVNEASTFTSADCDAAVGACTYQLVHQAAPAWERKAPTVRRYGTLAAVPTGWDICAILDDADQAGALGYHDETPDGRPYARVFARTSTANGDAVSSVLSHELLEMFVDPGAQMWAQLATGELVALEVGDPVQGDAYALTGRGMTRVSNFVLPAWFDPFAPAGSKLDEMGKLTKPGTMTPGGYLIVMKAGRVTQRFGESYDHDRQPAKLWPAARTAKRLAQSR